MKVLNQHINLLGVIFLNGVALLLSSPATLEEVKLLLQIFVLALTAIYTIVKFFLIYKDRKRNKLTKRNRNED